MANEKNLVPINSRGAAEQRKISASGGKRSGEARRKKRAFRDAAADMISSVISEPKLLELIKEKGFDCERMSYQEAMIAGMIYSAICGNAQAYRMVVETVEPSLGTAMESALEKLDRMIADIEKEASELAEEEP